jgi:hypothetical protein
MPVYERNGGDRDENVWGKECSSLKQTKSYLKLTNCTLVSRCEALWAVSYLSGISLASTENKESVISCTVFIF